LVENLYYTPGLDENILKRFGEQEIDIDSVTRIRPDQTFCLKNTIMPIYMDRYDVPGVTAGAVALWSMKTGKCRR